MYLKRLELIGFKSFADKTVLEAPGGLTVIVGPNGSGKSNIIDAIRWLFGEREAKNLRGAKAEDLIFAGTPKRSRMGMAQATIVFDNSSSIFPVDFKEVSIVKRIERDGVSQYLLNKAEVRLKDVIDFFAKVRLGTRGLSIINQGSSDLFVRATPEDRRIMIEEILGLRQYQLKKHEAGRKVKNTIINVEKVKAMIDEIAPHLRFLKRQTAKWGKLSDLENELKEKENIYFGRRLAEIESGFKKFNPEVKRLDGEITFKQKELDGFKKSLETVKAGQPKQKTQMDEIRKRRESLFNERSNIERDISKLEAKIEFLNSIAVSERRVDFQAGELLTALQETKEIIIRLLKEDDLEKVRNDLSLLLDKIVKIIDPKFDGHDQRKGEIGGLKKVKDEFLKKLQPISEEIVGLAKTEEETAKGFEHFNEEFRAAFEKLEEKKEEIRQLENEKNKILFEVERLNLRKQDLGSQISQSGRKIQEFQSIEDGSQYIDEMPQIERRILRLRSEITGIGEIDEALVKEAQETESRHGFLKTQLEDLEKAINDLERLIKELDEKINTGFHNSLKKINDEFNKFFNLMFGGGKAKMALEKPALQESRIMNNELGESDEQKTEESEEEKTKSLGIEIEVNLPRKRIKGLDMLSGGEKSLVSIAALFALISVSPPPFLVLDEIDAALDEKNTRRFADIIREFSKKTQFIIVTHNRATMEAASALYGVTMEEDGASKVLSLKFE